MLAAVQHACDPCGSCLIHVLPKGFRRIRHYGLLASGVKADNLALARKLLDVAAPAPEP
jgi:hypothetical protein